MGIVDARLTSLGLELPEENPPQGNYVPFVQSGALVLVAGQGPRKGGQLIYKGVIGDNLTLADGQAAARLCALNILGQLRSACSGDLDRAVRLVRVAGLVRCTKLCPEARMAAVSMLKQLGQRMRHGG
ncbi:RidA family protein [Ensifer sp. BR816]|uniref:RidA family protein n=1 Tax=Rhizobium sp. (strain BR816) TaxID=1057002 RepID=UPI000A0410B0|nr:RidA family protein [Ensifer sp. BR816]